LRRSRHVKKPYARRLQLVSCYGFKIKNGKLLLPLRPRQFISIPLNNHTNCVISHPDLTASSITLTENRLMITYAKESVPVNPKGVVGLDRNLDNVTSAPSDDSVQCYNHAKATEIRALYREIRSHARRNDHRTTRRIFAKYGGKERNRVQQLLHQTSKRIVEEAKQKQHAIGMEKLLRIHGLFDLGTRQMNLRASDPARN
jgi:transposase